MKIKALFYSILILIALYVIWLVVDITTNIHTLTAEKWRSYMYLFNDSIKQDIDTITVGSDVNKRDVCTFFNYMPGLSSFTDYNKVIGIRTAEKDSSFYITIWEFKDLANYPIDSVHFIPNWDLNNLKIRRGEVLDPYSEEPISIHFGYEYHKMNINIDKKSVLINPLIKGVGYKGFLGILNRVSLSNEAGKHEIFIDYKHQRPVLFLVVNKDKRFFIIIISSNKTLDESIIKILNL